MKLPEGLAQKQWQNIESIFIVGCGSPTGYSKFDVDFFGDAPKCNCPTGNLKKKSQTELLILLFRMLEVCPIFIHIRHVASASLKID